MSHTSSESRKLAGGPPAAMRYQPLVIVLAAACCGIVLDRLVGPPVGVWWAAVPCAGAAWLVLWRRGRDRAACVALLSAVASVAGAWHHCRWYLFPANDLGNYADAAPKPVCVEGVVRTGPQHIPPERFDPLRAIPVGEQTRVELDATRIRDGTVWWAVSGRATLIVNGHLDDVQAGTRVRVFARLKAPDPPQNPGAFDYAAHARADRKRSLLRAKYPECVTVLAPASGWSLTSLIHGLRSHGSRMLQRYVGHQRSGLASAVLLGAREQLDDEQSEAFFETGTVHLLAISGLHVGMVALILFGAMRLMLVRRRRAVAIVAVTILVYTLVTQARPPAVRAMILVEVYCAGVLLGRRALAFNSLAVAALIVLALNPADLFRPGAQLSFLAVASLAWFARRWFGPPSPQDWLDRALAESRPWPVRAAFATERFLRRLTLVGALLWLLTLPLVMARFHLVAPVAVALNTVVWIPMVLALGAGFGVLVFGWLIPPVGAALGWCCDGMLAVLAEMVNVARDLAPGPFWVPGPPDWWVAGFYGLLALLMIAPAFRGRRWVGTGVVGAWLLVGWIGPSAVRLAEDGEPGTLRCTFLSVGHGCAVVVELPGGETLLYDAGSLANPRTATHAVAGYLWSRGIRRIDAVALSHADVDHYNGLPGLVDRFSVGAVYLGPGFHREKEGDENAAIQTLHKALDRAGIVSGPLCGSDRIPLVGGAEIEVLHPPEGMAEATDNAGSIVLRIRYEGWAILLTGDIESKKIGDGSPGLNDLLDAPRQDCDVLLAPHHGSRKSNVPALAAWCTPAWVIVSGGHEGDLGQLRKTYQAVEGAVLRTAESGAIRVDVTTRGLDLTTYADDPW